MIKRVIHLTLTGFNAGLPLCTVNKAEAKEQGHEFSHAMYTPTTSHHVRPYICPECLELWEDESED